VAESGDAPAGHVAADHAVGQPRLIGLIEQPIVGGKRAVHFRHKFAERQNANCRLAAGLLHAHHATLGGLDL
jgi:hypothetical protein